MCLNSVFLKTKTYNNKIKKNHRLWVNTCTRKYSYSVMYNNISVYEFFIPMYSMFIYSFRFI